ncbi:MAG: hypothetical protein KDA65_14855 [Planctomycetaceae bacterium]|nr:hypothetical protein [Planctomycetaceae bacterium]
MNHEQFEHSKKYYDENYAILVKYPFLHKTKIQIPENLSREQRLCRFCGKTSPETSFRNKAHAVPEFLGNRSIILLNECDECNRSFASWYEDHLGKWSLFARSMTQTLSKKGRPTYKNESGTFSARSKGQGLELRIDDKELQQRLATAEAPFSFGLPMKVESQPFIKFNAAKAILKAACSVCPDSELKNIQPVIEMLMKRAQMTLSGFPVLSRFTPGPIDDSVSEIVILKRKTDLPIPTYWCIIQYRNHRLQTFLPFVRSDQSWMKMEENVSLKLIHYPSRFGPNWEYGLETGRYEDWSCIESKTISYQASIQLNQFVKMPPADSSDSST